MGPPRKPIAEFFKVFLPEFSLEKLHIPKAFIEHFTSFMPEKAILRDFIGKVWHVDMRKIEKDVYFMNGWQQFVMDNFVEEGDFLVFQYDGGYIFDFKLFGRTGCEKEYSKEVNVDTYKKDFCIKEEDVEEAKRKVEEDEDVEEAKRKGDEEEEEDSTEEEEEEDSTEEEEDSTEEEEEEEEEDSMEEAEEDESSDEGKVEINEEDEEEEESQPKSSSKRGVKHKHSGRGRPSIGRKRCCGYRQTPPQMSEVSTKEIASTERKYKKASLAQIKGDHAIDMGSIIEPRNPYFITKVRPMRKSKLYVPMDVLRDHDITLHPRVTLRDSHGRSWFGDVAVWKDGRTWISGWKAFCKWNHVGVNDTCICEFVQENGSLGKIIVVHIHLAQSGPGSMQMLKVEKR